MQKNFKNVLSVSLATLALMSSVAATTSSVLADPPSNSAPAATTPAQAIEQLTQITQLLSQIERQGLHEQDRGRILILTQVSNQVRDAVNQRGLGHAVTFHLYQQLIVKFRFSTQFFAFIRTSRTAQSIDRISQLITQIQNERGFDDEPYTKFLKANFEQMRTAAQSLIRASDVPAALQAQLRQRLMPLLADAMAQADQGDRPNAFAKAIEVYHLFQNLYPALNELHSSQPNHQLALEIIGLNEMVGEYSQVERERR